MFKAMLMLAILTSLGLSIAGCNTVHGAGQDVERGGEKMQDAADRNR